MNPIAPTKLNTAAAADYLGLRKSTLDTWRCLGRGPDFIKLGAKIIYLQRDLDAWIESRRTNCTSALDD